MAAFTGISMRALRWLGAAALSLLGAISALADAPPEPPSTAQLWDIITKDPHNRQARWAFAQRAYTAKRYALAEHHILQLLKTSRSEHEADKLVRALNSAATAEPFSFGMSFQLLPSSNVRRYTHNDTFETLLGIFTPVGNGNEESGIGAAVGASGVYRFRLPDQSQIAVLGRVDHIAYSASDLNRSHVRLGVRRTVFAPRQTTMAEPYLSFRFDEDLQLDQRTIGLNYARKWWREDGPQFGVSVTLEDRKYISSQALSGSFARLALERRFERHPKVKGGLELSFARSLPEAGHLKYHEIATGMDVSRNIGKLGIVGLFGNVTARRYDDVFPATNRSRKDDRITVGASYSPAGLKLFGSRPKLRCQFQRNTSNIALYEYKSTDCGLSFQHEF